MSLQLSSEDIATLEARTEGWIAGLQLAALALQGSLSMQGQPDTTSFIRSFTGSHRYILDYLVEEVLQRQPECVSSFLLQPPFSTSYVVLCEMSLPDRWMAKKC